MSGKGMIQFMCSLCGGVLRVAKDKAGRKGKCPKCGGVIVVPHVVLPTGSGVRKGDPGSCTQKESRVSSSCPAPSGEVGGPANPRREIIQCPKCGARNRVGVDSPRLRPICARCGTLLQFCHAKHSSGKPSFRPSTIALLKILLLAALLAIACGIGVTPSLMEKDFSGLISREQQQTHQMRQEHENELVVLKQRLTQELARIDAESLRRNARLHYKSVLDARRSYDRRYALTRREKAQLRMRELASDSTKSHHDAIAAVARDASPKGSEIKVRESVRRISLYIDFDMSTMTSGEHGTRTKHETKESLKKEVISLISRVTNDVFQFCRELDLDTIHVGCRHYVRTRIPLGTSRRENVVLYRIRIRKDRIPELKSDPFLDVYSTKAYLEVEDDKFDEIEIIRTRL